MKIEENYSSWRTQLLASQQSSSVLKKVKIRFKTKANEQNKPAAFANKRTLCSRAFLNCLNPTLLLI